jgi:hypothetical protein
MAFMHGTQAPDKLRPALAGGGPGVLRNARDGADTIIILVGDGLIREGSDFR